MQAPSSIEFDLTGIGGVLLSRLLAVPIYQRPYSWRETPVNEFLTDLRAAFGKKTPEYFLGTIVLTEEGIAGRHTIIDGQQRLATTAMLLASIRGEYKARGDANRARIIHSDYLSAADLESGEEVSRLRLSSDDDPFFKSLVIDDTASTVATRGSHELIKAAYDALHKEVKKLAADAGAEWSKRLLQWVEFLKTKVFVIVLEVPTEADAFLIFETLNDRGADLTIADLLKNFLFGRAEDRLDTVRDGWLMTLGSLEITQADATFTMFLRHYWSSHRGAIRERELYKDIKDNVTSASQAVDFVAALQKAARLYAALLNSDHDYWATLGTEGRANVETLLRLDLEQMRPLLLGAMQHFQTAELQRLLRSLVSWGVRGIIVGGIGGGTYEKAYCDAAVKIRRGDIKTVDELFTELARIIPTDEEFKAAFAVARVPKSNLARYYLIALERGKRGEKEPELVPNADENELNLEHVLPKNASDADWGGAFTLDERKDWVYRVGNLALLQKGPNGRIGSKPFSAKKTILAASALELTKEIATQRAWSPATIQARQSALSELAVTVWPRRP